MKFIAILSSVPFESDKILTQMKNVRRDKIAGKTVYRGKLSKNNILLVNTGIGKVNAGHSLTSIIERYTISHIINVGVGGAYPQAGLTTGDIAVALKEIYGDEGVITPHGWKGLKEIGIPLVKNGKKKYFNQFLLNEKLAKEALGLLQYTKGNLKNPSLPPFSKGGMVMTRRGGFSGKIKAGNFVTVSSVTGTHKRAMELEDRFDAICENMEGAAIAHVCAIYKIPMLELRGISNVVGDRDKRSWELKLAAENCQDAVLSIIRDGRVCL